MSFNILGRRKLNEMEMSKPITKYLFPSISATKLIKTHKNNDKKKLDCQSKELKMNFSSFQNKQNESNSDALAGCTNCANVGKM